MKGTVGFGERYDDWGGQGTVIVSFFLSKTYFFKRVDYTRLAIETKDEIFRTTVYILQRRKYIKRNLIQTSVKSCISKKKNLKRSIILYCIIIMILCTICEHWYKQAKKNLKPVFTVHYKTINRKYILLFFWHLQNVEKLKFF